MEIAEEADTKCGRATMAGEREYGFRHVLVCEVAYGQIPRLERAGRHRRAAAWLESLAAERSELLAHHYTRALELARAAGQSTGELAERARLALRDAGDRVTGLGAHLTCKGIVVGGNLQQREDADLSCRPPRLLIGRALDRLPCLRDQGG